MMRAVLFALAVLFLQNPSFEPPYIFVRPGKSVPSGWEIVQLPGEHEVEVGYISAPYTYRVYDGSAALKIVNPFAPMHVWVGQRIFIPAGLRVRFSVMAHAWYVADQEPPRLPGDIPVSSDAVSVACAFISPSFPPPPCPGMVINDLPYRRLEASATTDADSWWWVGIYAESPAGRNNDLYVDAATLEAETVYTTPVAGRLSLTPAPLAPRRPPATRGAPVWVAGEPTLLPSAVPTPLPPTSAPQNESPAPPQAIQLAHPMPTAQFVITTPPPDAYIPPTRNPVVGWGILAGIVVIVVLLVLAGR